MASSTSVAVTSQAGYVDQHVCAIAVISTGLEFDMCSAKIYFERLVSNKNIKLCFFIIVVVIWFII